MRSAIYRRRGSSQSRPRRARLSTAHTFVALVACLLGWACGSPYPTVRQIEDDTVPPGDTVPVFDQPVRESQSLRFSWEFDSHLEPAAYVDWVTKQLTARGFTVQQRQPSSIGMVRIHGGDAYRLRIDVTGGSPTHVRVTLRSSPN
jgi:hypothetical protein